MSSRCVGDAMKAAKHTRSRWRVTAHMNSAQMRRRDGAKRSGMPTITARMASAAHQGTTAVSARYPAQMAVSAVISADQCHSTRIAGQQNSTNAARNPEMAPASTPYVAARYQGVRAEPTTAVDRQTIVATAQNAIFERRTHVPLWTARSSSHRHDCRGRRYAGSVLMASSRT